MGGSRARGIGVPGRTWLKQEAISLAIVLAAVTAARSSLADHYYVPSGSMENSLIPGDRVFVEQDRLWLSNPAHEDRPVRRAHAGARRDRGVRFAAGRHSAHQADRRGRRRRVQISRRPSLDQRQAARRRLSSSISAAARRLLNLDDGGGPDFDRDSRGPGARDRRSPRQQPRRTVLRADQRERAVRARGRDLLPERRRVCASGSRFVERCDLAAAVATRRAARAPSRR